MTNKQPPTSITFHKADGTITQGLPQPIIDALARRGYKLVPDPDDPNGFIVIPIPIAQ